jgi:hypothetical protein
MDQEKRTGWVFLCRQILKSQRISRDHLAQCIRAAFREVVFNATIIHPLNVDLERSRRRGQANICQHGKRRKM